VGLVLAPLAPRAGRALSQSAARRRAGGEDPLAAFEEAPCHRADATGALAGLDREGVVGWEPGTQRS
jgi:hypothetical protein